MSRDRFFYGREVAEIYRSVHAYHTTRIHLALKMPPLIQGEPHVQSVLRPLFRLDIAGGRSAVGPGLLRFRKYKTTLMMNVVSSPEVNRILGV